MVQVKENSNSEEKKCVFERPTVEYTDQTDRFAKEGDNYTKQFASLYVKRLEEFYPILREKIKEKWGNYWIVIEIVTVY